jgi:hypothetical protein
VNELFRGSSQPDGWRVTHEVDTLVVVGRDPAADVRA